MLNQNDIVRSLSTEPPPEQHIVFSILHAYVFSKSRRGNLPSETLSKLLSVQRKLLIQRGNKPFPLDSPVARAFEAMRVQMLMVNKKWMVEGVSAFGPLGAIGSTGNSPLAIEAWRKATDNKIKQFPTTHGDSAMMVPAGGGGGRGFPQELDAGRVIGPGFTDSADPRTSYNGERIQVDEEEEFEGLPPGYDGPPTPLATGATTTTEQDPALVEAMEDRRLNGGTARPESLTTTASESGRTRTPPEEEPEQAEGARSSVSPPPPPPPQIPRNSIEAGVSELARLRALKEERERIEDETNRAA